MASSSPQNSCSSWETFDDVNFNDDDDDDDARTRRSLRRPSLADAQPSRNDRNRTTEDNKAVCFCNKSSDIRGRRVRADEQTERLSVTKSVFSARRFRVLFGNGNGANTSEYVQREREETKRKVGHSRLVDE